MEGVRPCPYCGGEVEVVKLNHKLDEEPKYRISCYRCHALVARGEGFSIEKSWEAKGRIQQYEEYMNRLFSVDDIPNFTIDQSFDAKLRDVRMAHASRTSQDDEVMEIHDANQRSGGRVHRPGVGEYDI